MSRKLLQQALDALETGWEPRYTGKDARAMGEAAIATLRAALAQPTPTPDYNDRLTKALYCGDVDELNRVLAEPAPAVPDGWVMVPREPTVEMRRAAARWLTHYHVMRAGDKTNAITDAWIAMIAAAPGSAPDAPAVPAVDCRTCARCYSTKGRGVFGCDSVVTCTNGDRYQPLPPVKLWRVD